MGVTDNIISLLTFLSVGINMPAIRKKSAKAKQEFLDTSELWLESQILSSKILKTMGSASIKSKKDKIIEKVKLRYMKLDKSIHTAKFMKLRDKIVFVFSLVNLAGCCLLLGKYPCYFYYYYVLCAVTLVPLRFINYRLKKYHYFLLDFCYYANTLCVLYLCFYKDSQMMFNIAFAFACGPLLLSVPLFSNSFIPHSIDKITSLVIHLLPGIALWTIYSCECSEFAESTKPLPFLQYYSNSVIVYSLWFFIYYSIIFVFAYERWQRKGNLTLYKWAMGDQNSSFYRFCGLFGERFRPIFFLFQHAIGCSLNMAVTYLFMWNNWALTIPIIIIAIWSMWNGASYYIDLFSSRYEKDIQTIEDIYSASS